MDSSSRIARNICFHVILLLTSASILWSCTKHSRRPDTTTYEIGINSRKSCVEVAFTQKERTMGLMFRDKLESNHGMLFIYPQEKNLSFWMKNTKIPLSIAFINSGGIITQIESMAPYSLTGHASKDKVQFALEMKEGWFRKNGVEVGNKVELSSEIKDLKVE